KADAPRSSAIVFDVHGPVEFLRTIRVDIQGRGTLETAPALGPAATFTLDWETYVRLACGRVTPEAVADRVKAEGDPQLTAAVRRHGSAWSIRPETWTMNLGPLRRVRRVRRLRKRVLPSVVRRL